MTMKSLFAAALLLCIGTAAMAKAKPVTLKIVSGSGKVLVNGKEYVPGSELPRGAKISVQGGDATLQIGDATVTAAPNTELKLSGSSIVVVSGSAQVTNAAGQ